MFECLFDYTRRMITAAGLDTEHRTGQDALLDASGPDAATPTQRAQADPVAAYLAATSADDQAREETRSGLLASLKDTAAVRAAAEVAALEAVLAWCLAHEVTTEAEVTWIAGYGDRGLGLGGPGCPLVRESAVIELAAALGVSTTSGAKQVAVVLELRYRLPRLWARVVSGACPVWRARLVAEKTMDLCEDGAEHLDRHVAPFAHAISYAQLSRLAEEALQRWDPAAAETRRRAAADGRRVDIRLADHTGGVVHLEAGLDLADALALEAAVRDRAADLAADGSPDTLHVRRSQALGSLAAGQPTLPTQDDGPVPVEPGRHLHLWAHLSAAAIDPGLRQGTGATWESELVARLDTRHPARGPISAGQVRDWARTAATITVRPVLDLAEAIHCDSYEASDRLKDQTRLRDHTCAFPWCTVPAEKTDMDHVVPWPDGLTESENIAPACRKHHRAKTHLGWGYQVLSPGLYLWTSPLGERYLRSHAGTHPLDTLPLDTVPPGPPPDPLPDRPPTTRYRPAPLVPDQPSETGDPPPADAGPPPF